MRKVGKLFLNESCFRKDFSNNRNLKNTETKQLKYYVVNLNQNPEV